jgi:Xaa-Pro aminopeptidase
MTPEADPHYQGDFSHVELRARRLALAAAIGEGSLALVQGAARQASMVQFRQTNEMYYLTGVEVPHTYLTIEGGSGRSVLYLPHRDDELERNEGRSLTAEDGELTRDLVGVEEVKAVESLASDLAMRTYRVPRPQVLIPMSPAEGAAQSRYEMTIAAAKAGADPWDGRVSREAHLISLLRARLPQLPVGDLSPFLDRMRLIKSPREQELLRRAARLTAAATTEAMRSTAPGVAEYELAAVASLTFLLGGARGDAYRAIVATGHNAWFGHYSKLDSKLMSGELVLMDYAPDFSYYTSDIGRMWPVDGRFTKTQRVLYGFIVDYHKTLLGLIRPGALPEDILREAVETMRPIWERTAFGEPHHKAAAGTALEFRGHLSHPVGMAVHDVGDYKTSKLEPGMVFSVDPMYWIPEDRLYIRCEDTVLVTADGIEVLTANTPLELEAVERTMEEEGILQVVRR